ncbi:Canalicular multispecific organic anion transporter 2 [Globomyces sp. JEL0801]|nr:Canalicular multispecific organic anion transporter 2 [Globomyces sp. JEL0801]
MIQFVDPKENVTLWFNSGLALAFVMVGLDVVRALAMCVESMTCRRFTQVLESTLTGAIYQKVLRLDLKSRQKFSDAHIMNLINQDVPTVIDGFVYFDNSASIPLQFFGTIYILFTLVGHALWPAIGVMVVMTLLSTYVAPRASQFWVKWIAALDKRIAVLREMLYGIRVIKYRAIEGYFQKKIEATRKEQFHNLSLFFGILGGLQGLVGSSMILMSVLVVVVYSALGNQVTAQVILPTILYMDSLQGPFNRFGSMITAFISGKKSLQRISALLFADEIEEMESNFDINSSSALKLDAVSWKWANASNPEENRESNETEEEEKDIFHLKNVSIDVKKGSLVAIVGAVGSGKSTLLSSILGETDKYEGDVVINGTMAYCPQQAWIQTGTIEKNIHFYSDSDESKMKSTIFACGMNSDLKSFSNGLKTEIGESGVNLSGGQKARVSLARAIYSDADIYLLDDPLAALDAQVGRHVFNHGIKGLLQEKTVLFVTHQLQYLQQVDHIIVLDQGNISESGTFNELINKQDGMLQNMMKSYKLDSEHDLQKINENATDMDEKKTEEESEEKKDEVKFEEDEEKQQGLVSSSVYIRYLKGVRNPLVYFLFVFLFAALLTIQILQPLWLAHWFKANDQNTNNSYMYVYLAFGSGQIIAYTSLFLGSFFASLYNACNFHDQAMNGLFHATIQFFDQNPVGRVINRMTADVRMLEVGMSNAICSISLFSASILSALYLACNVKLYMIVLFAFVIALYYFTYRYYQPSNIELKRLSSVAKSPLDSHINETLTGLTAIRAYKKQNEFVLMEEYLMDENLVTIYTFKSLQIWFSFRLRVLSSILTFSLALIASQAANQSTDFAAAIGIALTYVSMISSIVGPLLSSIGVAEACMNSVERLDYYATSLTKEADFIKRTDPSKEQWPTNGSISIKSLELVYPSRPDHAVIKDLSLDIKGGEKIGIIGRTGSGKSTLTAAFFRLMQPTKGNIMIDGRDISDLGLKTLRRAIQIIPQEPILFNGTFRSNLDFENEFTDDEVWDVLAQCGLKDYVSQQSEKLNAPITTGGENLSVGQRQLICLARAILMKPKLLFMDEATAAIDGEADKLIQKSIKEEFAQTTVLSIAHRLNTIADYDRVMVLDAGVLAEFDSPHALLSKPESLFSKLADATGKANAALLREIASERSG